MKNMTEKYLLHCSKGSRLLLCPLTSLHAFFTLFDSRFSSLLSMLLLSPADALLFLLLPSSSSSLFGGVLKISSDARVEVGRFLIGVEGPALGGCAAFRSSQSFCKPWPRRTTPPMRLLFGSSMYHTSVGVSTSSSDPSASLAFPVTVGVFSSLALTRGSGFSDTIGGSCWTSWGVCPPIATPGST